jgi:hypothetical protein
MATPTTLPSTFTSGQVLTAAQMNNLRGAFRVLQVVTAAKSDTFTTTSTSMTDLTDVTVSITPSATSSLILINVAINNAVSGDIAAFYQLMRGTTAIAIGDAAGTRQRTTFAYVPGASGNFNMLSSSMTFVDSPATTSATTYKVQCRVNAGTLYVNRNSLDSDATTTPRAISTITVMEISA